MGGKASGIERARRAYMKQSAREIILKMHYFYEAEEELEAEWKEFQRWRRRKKKRSTSAARFCWPQQNRCMTKPPDRDSACLRALLLSVGVSLPWVLSSLRQPRRAYAA